MDRPNLLASPRPKRPFPALEWLIEHRTAPLPAAPATTPAPTPASAPRTAPPSAAAWRSGQPTSAPRPSQDARPVPSRAAGRGGQPAPAPRPPQATRRGAPRSLTLYDYEARVLLSYAPEWLRELFLPRL